MKWHFQNDLIDSSINLNFSSIESFEFPNETLVTLVIDILKFRSSRHKSIYQGMCIRKERLYSSVTGTDALGGSVFKSLQQELIN